MAALYGESLPVRYGKALWPVAELRAIIGLGNDAPHRRWPKSRLSRFDSAGVPTIGVKTIEHIAAADRPKAAIVGVGSESNTST